MGFFTLILVILPVTLLVIFTQAKTASAVWFDDNYYYRQTVAVTNAGTAQTDFQISITLDTATLITAGKMQSDCDDIRVTDVNGKLLPIWLEKGSTTACNTSITAIWTKAPSLPTSGATFYVYYGNPSAANVQSGGSVFMFFDDFSNGLGAWTNPAGCGGTITSSQLTIAASTTCDSVMMYPTSINLSYASGYYFDFRGKFDSGGRIQMAPRLVASSGNFGRLWRSGTATYYQEYISSVFGGNTDIGDSGTSADTFYNWSVQVNGTNNTLYVNGTSKGSATTSDASLISETDLKVGLGEYNTAVVYDDVRIRKYASTAPSVGSPASEEKGPSPIGYWKFDDATGTNANDSTSNNNDGTITGATWQTEDQCISGKCLWFDGVDDRVVTAASMPALGTSYTISAWVRPTTTFAKGCGSGHSCMMIYQQDTKYFALSSTGIPEFYNGDWRSGSTALPLNQWSYVTVTTDNTNLYFYINGVLNATVASAGGTVAAATANIGTRPDAVNSSYSFNGFMDEYKVDNYTRSADQIKADYNARSNLLGAASVTSRGPNNDPGALNNNLVGYWKMDESSGNATDSSGNGNTGTNTNTATYTTGKFANAGTFNGTNQYFSAADASSLDITGNLTVSAWLKPSDGQPAALKSLVTKWNTSNLSYNLGLTTDGKIRLYVSSDGTTSSTYKTTDAAVFSDGAATSWTHVAAVYSTDGTVIIYINGASVASTATGTIPTSIFSGTAALEIAADAGGQDPYGGSADEVRIYSRALSPTDVTNLYNFGPGPMLYYNLEEGSGTTANDLSGNAYTGTITNATYRGGKYGKGLNFAASGQHVRKSSFTAINRIDTQPITVEAWIKPNWTSGYGMVVANRTDASYNWMLYQHTTSGTIQLHGASQNASTYTPPNGVWTHVAVTIETNQDYKMYINGALQQSISGFTFNSTGASELSIGDFGSNNEPWNGSIDEVKIYNYAITASQVVSDMNAGQPGVGSPVASAVAHWKFDEGSDGTCSGGTNDACNSGSFGSALDGAESGMAVPATATSGWTNGGKFSRALSFDGSNDYISVADNNSLDFTGDMTVSFWAYPGSSQADYATILSKHNSSSTAYTIEQYSNSTNQYYFSWGGGSFYCGAATDVVTLTASTWQHVVFSKTGATVTGYVNGVRQYSCTGASATIGTNALALNIGRWTSGASRYWSGSLDEFKIYDYGLTAAQVKVDMNRQSAKVSGALSDKSTYQVNAENQEYCVPGDTTSCAAPVGRWDFEQGTGTSAFDTSGGGYTGTLSGTTWASGKVGKGVKFDGSNDYVDIGAAKFDSVSSATVEFWMYYTGTFAANDVAWQAWTNGSNRINMYATQTTAKLTYEVIVGGSTATVVSDSAISANTWNHVALTCADGTNTMTMFVNGVKQADVDETDGCYDNIGTTLSTGFGGLYTNNSNYYPGIIDQARFFNYIRTPAQIAWDYNKGAPVAWWKMDECQGGTANDSSVNANAGTITVGGSGTYTSVGTCGTSSASTMWYNGKTGKYNYSLAFDGTDDYVSIGNTTSTNFSGTAPFSIAAWIKPATVSGEDTIFSKFNGGVSGEYLLELSDGKLYFHREVSPYAVTGSTTLSTGTWYHVAAVYDGTNIQVFLNGRADSSTQASGSISSTSNSVLIGSYLSSSSPAYFFSGQIDDLRVYNYGLTTTQLKALMNQGGSSRFGPVTGAP